MKTFVKAVIVAAAFACSASAADRPRFVIEAEDLPRYLENVHPLVISVQSKLAENPSGYFQGVIGVDQDDWTADSYSQQKIDDLTLWSHNIGGIGVGPGRSVVVYDDGELKFASRVRYLLSHYGVYSAVLVNGGWPAIQKLIANGKLKAQTGPTPPIPANYLAHVVQPPVPIASRAEVERALTNPDVMLIDVRTPAEYSGKKLVPPVTRGGHIPGAINIPLQVLFDPKDVARLMGAVGLRKAFNRYGADPDRTLIFYCQDGARSSLAASAAVIAAFPKVRLYYLSYRDWQSDPNLPVVTTAKRGISKSRR